MYTELDVSVMISECESLDIVSDYKKFIVESDNFYIINIPEKIRCFISDSDYHLMQVLAERFVCDEYYFAE